MMMAALLLLAAITLLSSTIIAADDAAAAVERIIDLSQPSFPRDEAAIAGSPGALAIYEACQEDSAIRAAIIIEKGEVVAEYYREGILPTDTIEVHSGTKPWTSLLIGILVDDGKLSVDETLGDIFPEEEAWVDVTDGTVEFRKSVTIESLLTMTSGLVGDKLPFLDFSEGGRSLSDALAYPVIADEGRVINYLGMSNILSYVIQRRAGLTPGDFARERVMPKLGIKDDDYIWDQNPEGIEFGFHGLHLNPTQMAKFSLLYLQKGLAGPNGEVVVSEKWVNDSFQRRASDPEATTFFGGIMDAPLPFEGETGLYFGYLWWGHPSKPDVFCSAGIGGNDICVDPDTQRVIVQSRDFSFNILSVLSSMDMSEVLGNFMLAPIALDETVSFRAPSSDGDEKAGNEVVPDVTAMKTDEIEEGNDEEELSLAFSSTGYSSGGMSMSISSATSYSYRFIAASVSLWFVIC